MAAKRKRYDDKFRASAVVMLQAAGYPETKGALTRVAKELKVQPRVISRWFNGEQNQAPDNIVTEKKAELADLFENVAHKYLTHANRDDVIEEAAGKDAVIAAATATDKMRLLRGLPTEIVQIMPDLLSAIEKLGQKPSDVFARIIERAAKLDR